MSTMTQQKLHDVHLVVSDCRMQAGVRSADLCAAERRVSTMAEEHLAELEVDAAAVVFEVKRQV